MTIPRTVSLRFITFVSEKAKVKQPRPNRTGLFLCRVCAIFVLQQIEDKQRLGMTKQVCFCAGLALFLQVKSK